MSAITNKGRELGRKIDRACYGDACQDLVDQTCSLIARHAVTLHRLYEDECNGHPQVGNPHLPIETVNKMQARWEERTERETARLEKRIRELAKGLPNVNCVVFNGDPRGAPVRLVTKDGSGDSIADPRGWCV